MITIYEIDKRGIFTGKTQIIPDLAHMPSFFVDLPPPTYNPATEIAQIKNGEWTVSLIADIPVSNLTTKKRYTFDEFIDALTEDELGIILEMYNSTVNTPVNRKIKKLWHVWKKEDNIDFNDNTVVKAIAWLVQNTTEWTGARAQELAGV